VPIQFRVDVTDRCVYAKGVDPLVDEDITRYQRELASHPEHGGGFDQFIDLTGLTGHTVTADGIRMGASMTGLYADQIRGSRMAIVATEMVAYGMARMFAAYAYDAMDVRIFRDAESARLWLGREEKKAHA
jgi:hypothetical protein